MGQLVFIPFSSAGSVPTPSSVLNFYLSGANGDDAFDGLTPATAKATPASIWALFPAGLAGPLVVHVGAAGVVGDDTAYDWSTMPVPSQLNATARIWLYGDGAGQPGEDGFEEITTGVCAPGTDATQITLAAPVVENEYQHFTLEMLDGPAIGYRRTIQQNTTTSLIPVRQFDNQAGSTGSVTPVSGNAFRVVRPSAIFSGIDTLEGQPSFLGGIGGGDSFAPLFLVNIAFAATTTSACINDCTLYAAGVEFRGTTFPFVFGCFGSFGWWDHLDTSSTGLPRSTSVDTAKSQWFEDINMSASLARLAEWRGWSVSAPDVVAPGGAIAIANFMTFAGCTMSAVGTYNAVRANDSTLILGGYFWGTIRTTDSLVIISGRGAGVASSTVSRYWMVLGGYISCSVPLVHESTSGAIEVSNDTYFAVSAGLTSLITTITTQSALFLSRDSIFFAGNGSFTLSSPCTSGTLNMRSQGRITKLGSSSQTWSITNTSSGPSVNLESASIFEGQTGTCTMVGPAVFDNSVFRFSGTTTITGNLTLSNDSTFISNVTAVTGSVAIIASKVLHSGNFTVSGAVATCITLTKGSSWQQNGGILSAIATSGDGMSLASTSQASLSATTNVVLTGVGGGTTGLRCVGGSKAWFSGAPSSVTGPAGADLVVGGNAAVANGTLAAANNFITDTDVTGLLGGGNTIGRAA